MGQAGDGRGRGRRGGGRRGDAVCRSVARAHAGERLCRADLWVSGWPTTVQCAGDPGRGKRVVPPRPGSPPR